MNMKKLFLGALLAVSATAFGVQTEVGTVVPGETGGNPTALASGSAELMLESYGSVRAITQGTLYLVLESEANNFNDADKLTFNFDTVNKGTKVTKESKFSARLYVGTQGADENSLDELLPVKFPVDITTGDYETDNVKLALIDDEGTIIEHTPGGENATFDIPVVNETNNVIGALVYTVKGASLNDGYKQLLGTVKADLYTKGAKLPTELSTIYGDSGTNAISDATGNFTATTGKFRLQLKDLDLSNDENVKAVAGKMQ